MNSVSDSPLPRILLVAPSIRIMGGQAVAAKQLLDDLRSDHVEIDFLPINPKPPGLLQYAERVKYLRTLVVSFFYFASLLWRVPQYDVIHIFSASYMSFIVSQTPAILISRMYGKKIVLNYHSGQCEDHLNRWGEIVYWILRRVDRIAVQSGYLVDVFRKHGFDAVGIANVIDVDAFPYRERSNFKPTILVPRMLDPLYNVGCAIRAFHIAKQHVPDAQLTLLGDGPEEQSLRDLVEKLQVRDVHFRGRVEREQIATVFSEHDVLLNSSSVDNMPISLLEGMASGLPVVTTEAGGIPYMITDRETGHLVPVDDHEALGARLLEVLRNPGEAIAMAGRAHEELENYRWPTVAEKWFRLYAELAPQRVTAVSIK